MSNIAISLQDLIALQQYVSASGSRDIARLLVDVNLYYTSQEIVSSRIPSVSPPQRIASITIKFRNQPAKTYTRASDWQQAWRRAWLSNDPAQSRSVEITRNNLAAPDGTPLTRLPRSQGVAAGSAVVNDPGEPVPARQQLVNNAVITNSEIINTPIGLGGAAAAGTFTEITEISTARVKDNIESIEDALALLTRLQGVTYDRRDTGAKEAGFIAEELARVLPDMVAYDQQGRAQSVKYTKLTAYLVEAVKSLDQKLTNMQQQRDVK